MLESYSIKIHTHTHSHVQTHNACGLDKMLVLKKAAVEKGVGAYGPPSWGHFLVRIQLWEFCDAVYLSASNFRG